MQISLNYPTYTDKNMKARIEQINQTIDDKRNRLKEKAERYFSAISLPSAAVHQQHPREAKKGNTPPISYLMYGIAGLSAMGAMATDSKILCLSVAAVSAFGGYKLSVSCNVSQQSPSAAKSVNISSVKNDVISSVLDSVKKIRSEWESFMELKQKEIQTAIETSSLEDNQKKAMLSKTFIYEVINISIYEFSTMISSCANITDIKQMINAYKSTFISSIDDAADKQIAKYNSMCKS